MTAWALALILTAAFLHATWNLLAKRVAGGAAFVWLFEVVAVSIYAPLAVGVIVIQRPELGPVALAFLVGSGALHLVYFVLLQRGYRFGDLSLVYPLARGTGPLLAMAGAVVILDERPGPLVLGGALLIALGVFLLTGDPRKLRDARARSAVAYALLTGIAIATYTIWDKYTVSTLRVPPLLLIWASDLALMVLLTPFALRHWEAVRTEWRTHRVETIGVALLHPLSYILVLTAMVFTDVSYVAPAREISILVGAMMGTRLLAEGDVRRRLAAAGAMVLGLVALSLG